MAEAAEQPVARAPLRLEEGRENADVLKVKGVVVVVVVVLT